MLHVNPRTSGGSGTAVGPGLHLTRPTYTLQPEVCHQTIHLTLRGSGTALGPGLYKTTRHIHYRTKEQTDLPKFKYLQGPEVPLLAFLLLLELLYFCFHLFVAAGEFLALTNFIKFRVL